MSDDFNGVSLTGAFTLRSTYWQWRVVEGNKSRVLRWRMTEAEAEAWAVNNGKALEKVEGSAEIRGGGGERPSYDWDNLAPK